MYESARVVAYSYALPFQTPTCTPTRKAPRAFSHVSPVVNGSTVEKVPVRYESCQIWSRRIDALADVRCVPKSHAT